MEHRLAVKDNTEASDLFGRFDRNLRTIEDGFGVQITVQDGELRLAGPGPGVQEAASVIEHLLKVVREGRTVTDHDVRYAMGMIRTGQGSSLSELFDDVILVTHRGRRLQAKTVGQKRYVTAMMRSDIVFGIGPAGTGKTYLAVAMAVAAYKDRAVSRIVLTRPAVEAGERLGFLPGDLQEKVNPYLRPLYDSLFDTLGMETFEKYMSRGVIEVAPLAYMRGRTLDDSFVILDEAQNTTSEQMKMLLTRLGLCSRLVVTGDITQVDLPRGKSSGLEQARTVLRDVEGIEFVYLTEQDVVRHELVSKIVKAYERHEREKAQTTDGRADASDEQEGRE